MEISEEIRLTRYPNQKVVIVMYKEHCRSDGVTCYATRLETNRADIEAGLRLVEHYKLRQMERGKSNSRLHGRQPGHAERDMTRNGQAWRSENARVRATVARRVEEVSRITGCRDPMGELKRRLAKDGITLSHSKDGSLQYRFHSKSLGGVRKVNGARLGFARNTRTGKIIRFTARGIGAAIRLAQKIEYEQEREIY